MTAIEAIRGIVATKVANITTVSRATTAVTNMGAKTLLHPYFLLNNPEIVLDKVILRKPHFELRIPVFITASISLRPYEHSKRYNMLLGFIKLPFSICVPVYSYSTLMGSQVWYERLACPHRLTSLSLLKREVALWFVSNKRSLKEEIAYDFPRYIEHTHHVEHFE